MTRGRSDIAYVSGNATRKIFALPGGDASIAVGAESRIVHENNPGRTLRARGQYPPWTAASTRGARKACPRHFWNWLRRFDSLEVDAAGRVDHYNTSAVRRSRRSWDSSGPRPAAGVPRHVCQGFRAPSIAESGAAGSASSEAPAPVDPVRCPVTNSIGDCGGRQRSGGFDHQ